MRGNRRLALAGGVCVLAAVLAGGPARSQEKPAPGQPDAKEMAAMMAKWQAVMTPGEMHKHLEPLVGTWDTTMKMWMGGPGGPVTESKGTAEVRWVLGGRFVHETFKGEMKMPGPDGKEMSMPFEGAGMTGYDNFRKLYVGSWADTMGTQMLTMKGNYDPEKKDFTFYGEMDEPAMDLVGRPVKYVTRIVDERTHVFEIYDLRAGDGVKAIEITYKRK
jgi:hypothetical protein